MSETDDKNLDGTLCQECGELTRPTLPSESWEPPGYPISCKNCLHERKLIEGKL